MDDLPACLLAPADHGADNFDLLYEMFLTIKLPLIIEIPEQSAGEVGIPKDPNGVLLCASRIPRRSTIGVFRLKGRRLRRR